MHDDKESDAARHSPKRSPAGNRLARDVLASARCPPILRSGGYLRGAQQHSQDSARAGAQPARSSVWSSPRRHFCSANLETPTGQRRVSGEAWQRDSGGTKEEAEGERSAWPDPGESKALRPYAQSSSKRGGICRAGGSGCCGPAAGERNLLRQSTTTERH